MGRFFSSVVLFFFARAVFAAPKLPPSFGQTAGGSESQIVAGKTLTGDGISLFQLANFLENLEAAYFQAGANNYTQWKSTVNVNGVQTSDVVKRIAAQESIHVETIKDLLKANNAATVTPCQYQFPVTDETSFLALASIITNVGIGALIDLEGKLAVANGALESSVASIIPVESRHDAFFRLFAKEVPNPTSFETRISGIWAYNLALDFIVHGSCTNLPVSIKSLPVFPDLMLSGAGEPSFANPNAPGKLIFKVGQPNLLPQGFDQKDLWVGWVNENDEPYYTPVTHGQNGELHADVPAGLFGMTYAVLTGQNQAKDIAILTSNTIAGPLPIPLGPGNL